MEVKHYAKIYYPGAFVSESSVKEIDKRDISVVKLRKSMLGVELYDVVTMKADYKGKKITFKSENIDNEYFPIGKVVTLEEVGKEYGTNSTAYLNLSHNGYEYALKTAGGRMVFLDKEDVDNVIDPDSIIEEEAERE